MLWDRGINASKNMANIARSIWDGQGRPSRFTKTIAVEEAVLSRADK